MCPQLAGEFDFRLKSEVAIQNEVEADQKQMDSLIEEVHRWCSGRSVWRDENNEGRLKIQKSMMNKLIKDILKIKNIKFKVRWFDRKWIQNFKFCFDMLDKCCKHQVDKLIWFKLWNLIKLYRL